MSETNEKQGDGDGIACYVAVLKRAIPVNDYSTDTLTHVIREGESVRDVMDWAENCCRGSTSMISLEIVKAT